MSIRKCWQRCIWTEPEVTSFTQDPEPIILSWAWMSTSIRSKTFVDQLYSIKTQWVLCHPPFILACCFGHSPRKVRGPGTGYFLAWGRWVIPSLLLKPRIHAGSNSGLVGSAQAEWEGAWRKVATVVFCEVSEPSVCEVWSENTWLIWPLGVQITGTWLG